MMTVSGVLSAWARLPAWRRASSAWRSVWSSLDHRRDLDRQPLVDAGLHAGAHRADLAPDLAQRPQPVGRLQRRHQDQAEAQGRERSDQRLPQRLDLFVEALAGLRDLEAPERVRSRQTGIALHDPQRLVLEGAGIEDVIDRIRRVVRQRQRAIP
jgi:hypothetical protein